MSLSLRMNSGLLPARTSHRVVAARAYLASEVPPNVREARAWIAAWKARQAPADAHGVPAPAAPVVPPNVQEARDWIAAWKARQAPNTPQDCKGAAIDVNAETVEIATRTGTPGPIIAADGTLTFTKDILDSSTYEDLLKAMVAKEKRK